MAGSSKSPVVRGRSRSSARSDKGEQTRGRKTSGATAVSKDAAAAAAKGSSVRSRSRGRPRKKNMAPEKTGQGRSVSRDVKKTPSRARSASRARSKSVGSVSKPLPSTKSSKSAKSPKPMPIPVTPKSGAVSSSSSSAAATAATTPKTRPSSASVRKSGAAEIPPLSPSPVTASRDASKYSSREELSDYEIMSRASSRKSLRPRKAQPTKSASDRQGTPYVLLQRDESFTAPESSAPSTFSLGHTNKFSRMCGRWCGRVVYAVKSFGYARTIAALILFVLYPALTIGAHLLCNKESCGLRRDRPVRLPTKLMAMLDQTLLLYGAGLIALQFVVSAIPIGRLMTSLYDRQLKHRSNGFLCLLVTVAVYAELAVHLRLSNALVLHTVRFKSVVAMTLISLGVATLLFFKATCLRRWTTVSPGQSNSGGPATCPTAAGDTRNVFHDWLHGRERAPRLVATRKRFLSTLANIDLGFVLVRASNALWILALLSSVLYHLRNTASAAAPGVGGATAPATTAPFFGLGYQIALMAAMQGFYVFLSSVNEVFLMRSVAVQEGVGFRRVFLNLVAVPMLASLPLKYLVDTPAASRTQFSIPCYLGILLVYFAGMTLIHVTNAVKYSATAHSFNRRQPFLAFLRHPNYLGELLCAIAWTSLVGAPWKAAPLAYAYIVCLILQVWQRVYIANLGVATVDEYRRSLRSTSSAPGGSATVGGQTPSSNAPRYRIIPFIY